MSMNDYLDPPRSDKGRRSVQVPGIGPMLLSSAALTAANASGHAVIGAAVGKPPAVVRIWPKQTVIGEFFAGECDVGPDSPEVITFDPRTHPRKTIEYACVIMAGLAAEVIFTTKLDKSGSSRVNYIRLQRKYGSRLDDIIEAKRLIFSAAESLRLNQQRLFRSTQAVVGSILRQQSATVTALQRRLVAEHNISGSQLAEMLNKVPRYAVASSVIGRARAWSCNRAHRAVI